MTEPPDLFGDPVPTAPKLVTGGRYRIPHPITGEHVPRGWMRVSNLVKKVDDTFMLRQWGLRLVAKGIALRPDLYARACAAELADHAELQSIAADAIGAAGGYDRREQGTMLHRFTEKRDRGEVPVVPPQWHAEMRAYDDALAAAGITILPGMIECTGVVLADDGSPLAAGTFDRLGIAPGWRLPRVLDLKTGDNPMYGDREMPAQLSLYSRMRHRWHGAEGRFSAFPEIDQEVGMIIHLPVGGGECTLLDADLTRGWQHVRWCREVLAARKESGLLTPHTPLADPFAVPT